MTPKDKKPQPQLFSLTDEAQNGVDLRQRKARPDGQVDHSVIRINVVEPVGASKIPTKFPANLHRIINVLALKSAIDSRTDTLKTPGMLATLHYEGYPLRDLSLLHECGLDDEAVVHILLEDKKGLPPDSSQPGFASHLSFRSVPSASRNRYADVTPQQPVAERVAVPR